MDFNNRISTTNHVRALFKSIKISDPSSVRAAESVDLPPYEYQSTWNRVGSFLWITDHLVFVIFKNIWKFTDPYLDL